MPLIVYKSSAGSGKTYALVKEYLLLVLSDPQIFRHILAVTFTNKAANEMKERIIEALCALQNAGADISSGHKSLFSDLKEVSDLDIEEIQAAAGTLLTTILHNYSDFSVSTIDAFSHRLVRTFTRDLGLPYQFEVELDENLIIGQSVDLLLEKVGQDELITRAAVDFLVFQMDQEKSWQVELELRSFAKKLLREESFEFTQRLLAYDESVFKHAREQIIDFIVTIENTFQDKAGKMIARLQASHIAPDDLADGSAKGIMNFLLKLSQRNVEDAFALKSWKSYPEKTKWYSGSAAPDMKAIISQIQGSLREDLLGIIDFYEQESQRYYLFKMMLPRVFTMALLSGLQQSLNEVMDNNNLVHISEFNKRIAALIHGVTTPYIYERFGERYKHFLIDEFQDTSVLQWQNFLPLIDNSLAHGKTNLLVGDAKQAIYRFRSGEVEQFIQLPSLLQSDKYPWLKSYQKTLEANYTSKQLDTNYRSAKTIVDFNNRFFQFASTFLSDDHKNVYHDLEQKAVRQQDGLVEIQFLDNETNAIDDQQLVRILEIIHHLTNEGYTYDKIAILTRSNKEGSATARYLNLNNIGVISADSLLVNSSVRVKAIVSALAWLSNPDDTIALIELLYYKSLAVRESDITWINSMVENAPYSTTGAYKLGALLFSSDEVQAIVSRNIYDLVEGLIRKFGFVHEHDQYLQFFLEYVYEFHIGNKGSLRDFLDVWETSGDSLSVVVPEGTNSVSVMTVHKAKGLEFPVVIYAFANDSLNRNTRQDAWLDLQQEKPGGLDVGLVPNSSRLENTRFAHLYHTEREKTKLDILNNIYVAMTRASERMYVLCDQLSHDKEAFSLPYFLKQFLQIERIEPIADSCYRFGVEQPVIQQYTLPPDLVQPIASGLISINWVDQLKVAGDGYQDARGKMGQTPREAGNLVHRMLSGIRVRDDVDTTLNRYFYQGMIDADQKQKYHRLFNQLFENETITRFFDAGNKIRTEQDLISSKGTVLRPDRIIEYDEKVVLVDFKTGKHELEHIDQILGYQSELSAISDKPIESFLIYLNQEIELIAC